MMQNYEFLLQFVLFLIYINKFVRSLMITYQCTYIEYCVFDDYAWFLEITRTKCCKKSIEQPPCNVQKSSNEQIKNEDENKVRKNILQMNIIDVIRKVPPLPKHRVQDTRDGHVIILDKAGLEPTYVSKKVRKCIFFLIYKNLVV